MGNYMIHYAKKHLSSLLQRALQGEEVIVSKGPMPIVKLVPLKKVGMKRTIGGAKGLVKKMADDFNAPLPEFHDHSHSR